MSSSSLGNGIIELLAVSFEFLDEELDDDDDVDDSVDVDDVDGEFGKLLILSCWFKISIDLTLAIVSTLVSVVLVVVVVVVVVVSKSVVDGILLF